MYYLVLFTTCCPCTSIFILGVARSPKMKHCSLRGNQDPSQESMAGFSPLPPLQFASETIPQLQPERRAQRPVHGPKKIRRVRCFFAESASNPSLSFRFGPEPFAWLPPVFNRRPLGLILERALQPFFRRGTARYGGAPPPDR